MISNVLSEAIEQIKRYRLEFDTFPTVWPEMDDLVSRMDQMRAKLDSGNKIDEPEDYVRPGTNEIPQKFVSRVLTLALCSSTSISAV
jgi:hypothetical protein